MSNKSIRDDLVQKKVSGFLTIALAALVGVGVSTYLIATSPEPAPVAQAEASRAARNALDRTWLWQRPSVDFDDMYRTAG